MQALWWRVWCTEWPSAFEALEAGDVYQFGVAEGYSLRGLVQVYGRQTWAFDTFAGMPDPEHGEPTFERHWRRGAFRPHKNTAIELPLLGTLASKVKTIVGPFKESLKPGMAASYGMRPAVYLDIDADLYSSALTALDWMFAEGLVVKGTVIGYDDYWDLACKHRSANIERFGEARAHAEIAAKYNVTFRCICGPCARLPSRGEAPAPLNPWGWRAYFVVVGFGEAFSGVTISDADAKDFVESHAPCRGLWDRASIHWLGIE